MIHVLELVQLVPIYLVVVVLQKIYSALIGQVDFLSLLGLWMHLKTHHLLLLMHDHSYQFDQFVADRLILFPLYLRNPFLLDGRTQDLVGSAIHIILFHVLLDFMLNLIVRSFRLCVSRLGCCNIFLKILRLCLFSLLSPLPGILVLIFLSSS